MPDEARERAGVRAIRICDLVRDGYDTRPASDLWRDIVAIMDEHAADTEAHGVYGTTPAGRGDG